MRSLTSALFFVFLMLLASCTSQVQCNKPNAIINGECCFDVDANSICDKNEQPVLNLTPAPVETPPPVSADVSAGPVAEKPKPQVSNVTKKWEARLAQKVKSYQFVGRAADMYHGTFYVLGPRVRIDLENVISINVPEGTDQKINRIYINNDEGTALGVCSAGFILCKSRKGDSYAIDYGRFSPTLPPDLFKVVQNLPLDLEQAHAEVQQDRQMTLLRYVDGKTTHNLYVDEFFGMPLRYVIEKDSRKTLTEYKSIAFNTVSDQDFKLPVFS